VVFSTPFLPRPFQAQISPSALYSRTISTHLKAFHSVHFFLQIMSSIHQQNARTQQKRCANYHLSPTCFGAYCAIFSKNFLYAQNC
jgi:hypothetical protein